MLNTAAIQTVIDATLVEADRTRSAKLLAATRELDVVVESIAKGLPVTREQFIDRVQAVVLQAGLVDAATEFAFRAPAKALATRLA
jgi:hypothetical protein